jgi:membrane protein YqaA with SNARE-associated domain
MGFSRWVIATFTSPAGIFALAVIDSTLFFSLPFGIDAAIIVLAARSDTLAWTVPLLATAGSLLGGSFTFWMGTKVGDAGLERFVPERRLKRVRDRIEHTGAIALASLNVIPPPFPFTLFVLAAGALEVRRLPFFATFVVTRLARFGLEAYLAVRYGRRILRWLESPVVEYAVAVFILLAMALTAISIFKLFRSSRRPVRASA